MTAEQTTNTNRERATAQRRLLVEVVAAAPKLPPSAALLLSSLLPTRGTGHLPERTTRTGALRDCEAPLPRRTAASQPEAISAIRQDLVWPDVGLTRGGYP